MKNIYTYKATNRGYQVFKNGVCCYWVGIDDNIKVRFNKKDLEENIQSALRMIRYFQKQDEKEE